MPSVSHIYRFLTKANIQPALPGNDLGPLRRCRILVTIRPLIYDHCDYPTRFYA